MSYKCDRCLHYTADNQKHECVMDELEELRKDRDRLNWMLENEAMVSEESSGTRFWCEIKTGNRCRSYDGKTRREAIDSAMGHTT